MSGFGFTVIKKGKKSRARVGVIRTAHGNVETPAFTPVGTRASVRSLTPEDLRKIGVQLIFGNTYHLHLRPGEDVIKKFGGLGTFMGWKGPTITDSGGFQVFSLGQKRLVSFEPDVLSIKHVGGDGKLTPREKDQDMVQLVKITEDGVKFRSHIDGSVHMFTPEESIKIQKKLGADIMLAFDECAPYPSTHAYTKKAMERTHAWAIRSLEYFNNVHHHSKNKQALYGIAQGGVYKDLREESAKFIGQLPFDGIAIGGVSVGESKKEMRDAIDWSVPFLPIEKPRHLLGIGEVDDIFDAVERGMDTFDCVIPTRFGRYGIVFVSPPEGNIRNKFRLDLMKVIHAKDKHPIAKNCPCYVCQNYTRAYLHHLFRNQELLAYRLASYHNVFFLVHLTKQIRRSILEDQFGKLKKQWVGY